jgi:hypothetical protein
MTKPDCHVEHEQKDTLSVDVLLPGHEDRTTTTVFTRTKHVLMKLGTKLGFVMERPEGRCWICNGTEAEVGGPLEAHHFGVERAYIGASLRWDLIEHDFPNFNWDTFDSAKPADFIDNMESQGVLLCKQHHTGKDSGIHDLPFSVWIMQRYLCDGTAFSPNEIIKHDEV